MRPKAIVTIPPYAPFIDDVLRHPAVSGVRLNTVMPLKESIDDVLERLSATAGRFGKELWVDLKSRQLRVKTFGVPPFTEIELTHNIHVDTPVTAYFSNGLEHATVLQVDGNRLIMQEGPKRVVGPGESVNIPYPSLEIDGFFTETDMKYVEAGKRAGIHNYMLSFVEQKKDIDELIKLDPLAKVVAKIESQKGMQYVSREWNGESRLMAARGDMYIELAMPHHVIDATETIARKDPSAIAASRIFSSLSQGLDPSCEDIGDVDNLMRMGYRTLMLGDDICMKRESVMSGLNLLYAMAEKYKR